MDDPTPERTLEDTGAAVARRTMLRGVVAGGAVVASGALLAACGSDNGSSTAASTPTPSPTPTDSKSGGSGSGADVLVATTDVPEGGGVILSDEKVVVTQPKSGDFACFSSICTHAGCEVGDVSGGTINCPCHGSQYSIDDGSVVTGPATAPLPPVDIQVEGDSVVRT
ncbi:MAG: Rieske (2Fe-2S) protein [Actinomycetes bacterium]